MPPVYYHEGKFPPDERLDWSKLIPLIGRAAAAVARYDGLLGATPNPDVLLAPLTTREAVLSSRHRRHPGHDGRGAGVRGRTRARLARPPRRHPRGSELSFRHAARRDAYYDGLLAVSRDDDWTGWCRFFLEAVQVQAEDNLAKAQGIIDLYDRMKERVAELPRSRYAIRALDWIFAYPIFLSTHFVREAGIPEATARRFLRVLREREILEPVTRGRGRRGSILIFPSLLNITEDGEAF